MLWVYRRFCIFLSGMERVHTFMLIYSSVDDAPVLPDDTIISNIKANKYFLIGYFFIFSK